MFWSFSKISNSQNGVLVVFLFSVLNVLVQCGTDEFRPHHRPPSSKPGPGQISNNPPREICRYCIPEESDVCSEVDPFGCNMANRSEILVMRPNRNVIQPPKVHCVEPDRILLSWDKHNNTAYFIEYNAKGSRIVPLTNMTSCNFMDLSDLTPNTTYNIRLWSFNPPSDMYNRSSEIVVETTHPNSMPLPVENLHMYKFNSYEGKLQAIIKWTPPKNLPCHYDLVWYDQEFGMYSEKQITNEPIHVNEFTMENLEFDQNYTFCMTSTTRKRSKESNKVCISFETPRCLSYLNFKRCVPDTPQNFSVQEQLSEDGLSYDIIVKWAKPQYKPDYYLLFLNNFPPDIYTNTSLKSLNISGDANEAELRGIKLGVSYKLSLTACTVYGASTAAVINREIDNPIPPVMEWMPADRIILLICLTGGGISLLIFAFVIARHFTLKRRKCKIKKIENEGTEIVQQNELNNVATEMTTTQIITDSWEIDGSKLTLQGILGEGAFGLVRKGCFTGASQNCLEVAVKMLRDKATEEQINQIYDEIEIMKSVPHHPHLVSLIGVITKGRRRDPLLIVEYCRKGDLQTFLRRTWEFLGDKSFKMNVDKSKIPGMNYSNKLYELNANELDNCLLLPKDLISIARQVAMGMEYLSSIKVIHRDLAARNILICDDNMIKISDFGLSRDVYIDNIYLKTTGGKLPFRWMALESMTHQCYTTHSDVWSFGILLWEIVTLGGTPYPTIDTQDLLQMLKEGYRMEKPFNCSQQLYNIMSSCWKTCPKDRPNFTDLRKILESMLHDETQYLSLEVDTGIDNENYQNMSNSSSSSNSNCNKSHRILP